MNAKDVIRHNFKMTDMIVSNYLKDLSDTDLLVVPVEGMHPIAWQIGHLIVSERNMMDAIQPGASPALPDGFEEAHPRQVDPSGTPAYRPKDEYLALMKAQREASLALLESLPDEALDTPSPEKMRGFIPTFGHIFYMAGAHSLMHAGQFVAVRRQLQKPIAI